MQSIFYCLKLDQFKLIYNIECIVRVVTGTCMGDVTWRSPSKWFPFICWQCMVVAVRGRGGAGCPACSQRRAPAPRARCTLHRGPMHRARVLHPFKFRPTSNNNHTNETRPYVVRKRITTEHPSCADTAPPSITRFPALTDRWTITALFTYRRLRINT